jgi:hypothetical protein
MVVNMSGKLLDSDFIMVEVSTPLGDPTLISQTAFLAEQDETKGLNFWSLNPNIITQTKTGGEEKMAKRPISEHILEVLSKAHNETGTFDFKEIQTLLSNAGYKHTGGMVKDNLNILTKDGKITKTTTKVGKKEVECFGVVASITTPSPEPTKAGKLTVEAKPKKIKVTA